MASSVFCSRKLKVRLRIKSGKLEIRDSSASKTAWSENGSRVGSVRLIKARRVARKGKGGGAKGESKCWSHSSALCEFHALSTEGRSRSISLRESSCAELVAVAYSRSAKKTIKLTLRGFHRDHSQGRDVFEQVLQGVERTYRRQVSTLIHSFHARCSSSPSMPARGGATGVDLTFAGKSSERSMKMSAE